MHSDFRQLVRPSNGASRESTAQPYSSTMVAVKRSSLHVAVDCRLTRNLFSKRAPTAADGTTFLDAATPARSAANPAKQPHVGARKTLARRHSSGHIVVLAHQHQQPRVKLCVTTTVPQTLERTHTSVSTPPTATTALGPSSISVLAPAAVRSNAFDSMYALARDVTTAFAANVPPIPIDDCTGGVYYLRTKTHRMAAVFKPSDEEPFACNNPKQFVRTATAATAAQPAGIRTGISPGDAAVREVAAFLLDQHIGAGVPTTVLATAAHSAFHCARSAAPQASQARKSGALQQYVPHKCTADDVASSLFRVTDVHAIALLDIRLANQDRHGGNVLVVEQTKRTYTLVPIDHGACLPRVTAVDETSFLWLDWPQAKQPFDAAMCARIAALDATREGAMLRATLPPTHQLEFEAVLTLHLCTALLQVCVLTWHMTPHAIGRLMCRSSPQQQHVAPPSAFELLIAQSLEDVAHPADQSAWTTSSSDTSNGNCDVYVKALTSSFKRHLTVLLTNR